jgi:hypothetical protein
MNDGNTALLQSKQAIVIQMLRFARIGSVVIVLIGFLCLYGWHFNILFLKTFFPFTAFMNPLSAIGFICSACSLFILLQQTIQTGQMKSVMHYIALILSSITVLLGLLVIGSYLGIFHSNFDQLLFTNKLAGNRISPNSGINHFFIGIALLFLQFHSKKYFIRIAQVLTLLVAIISMFAVIGYIYNALTLYKVTYLAPMPLSSALAFSILCISLLFAKSDHGITKILTRNTVSSTLALRLIVITLTLPAALAYILLLGEQLHFFDVQTEMGLLVIWTIILLTSIIWVNTRTIQHIELENLLIKNELEQKNIKLAINAEELATKTLSLEEKNREIVNKLDVRNKLYEITDTKG